MMINLSNVTFVIDGFTLNVNKLIIKDIKNWTKIPEHDTVQIVQLRFHFLLEATKILFIQQPLHNLRKSYKYRTAKLKKDVLF